MNFTVKMFYEVKNLNSKISPVQKINTKEELINAIAPTIANGQFIPNLDTVQKELEEYFAGNQRLKYYAILDHVIDKGWELTTKEIKELIGYRPKGKIYEYGSYRFRRVGKTGRAILWSVYKVQIEYLNHNLKLPLGD